MKIAMVFPGQGSQAVGMMKAYAGLPEIEKTLQEAEDVLGAQFVSILDAGPAEKLNLTINTQAAMVIEGSVERRVSSKNAWGKVLSTSAPSSPPCAPPRPGRRS